MQPYLLSEHVKDLQCLTNIASPAGSLDGHSENIRPSGPPAHMLLCPSAPARGPGSCSLHPF